MLMLDLVLTWTIAGGRNGLGSFFFALLALSTPPAFRHLCVIKVANNGFPMTAPSSRVDEGVHRHCPPPQPELSRVKITSYL